MELGCVLLRKNGFESLRLRSFVLQIRNGLSVERYVLGCTIHAIAI